MGQQNIKELYKKTFNTVAEGYDNPAMHFFPESAQRIASYLNLKGNEHVLDVATGTGCAALALAHDLPDGQVTGLDFSTGMLAQAMEKQEQAELDNIFFVEMDMQAIDYPDQHFDAAVSAFSIFFVDDMERQLAHIADKVKAGGRVITTTFYDTAFTPLVGLFLRRLQQYGIEPPSLAWKRVATEEQCLALFQAAGLQDSQCHRVECGYHLQDASEWWCLIWNGGFRGLVNQLAPDDMDRFQEEHLAEVQALASEQGIWLEMNVLYTVGKRTV
ncbi:MAG: class I SAM-dependent methyltransferase [Candidatus Electrothrix aestuarii]|uniref:Class I SAM-dependent methyltransferase n=1 Tax=Candidatus Electrothrix aestuarii TaxID=3062594 RepID=A0AAU8LZH7_9BACT|nr:class I SAM-dependent methyltransferase [Candidatus Electrothrix aestuarii]